LITSSEPVQPKLVANQVSGIDVPQRSYINDEPKFRFEFNENTMAVEKLREGISKFSADTEALRLLLLERFVR
jgi:transaldolase